MNKKILIIFGVLFVLTVIIFVAREINTSNQIKTFETNLKQMEENIAEKTRKNPEGSNIEYTKELEQKRLFANVFDTLFSPWKNKIISMEKSIKVMDLRINDVVQKTEENKKDIENVNQAQTQLKFNENEKSNEKKILYDYESKIEKLSSEKTKFETMIDILQSKLNFMIIDLKYNKNEWENFSNDKKISELENYKTKFNLKKFIDSKYEDYFNYLISLRKKNQEISDVINKMRSLSLNYQENENYRMKIFKKGQ